MTLTDEELQRLATLPGYPRSAKYSARFLLENVMGPNPLWQVEALAEVMTLRPGMRVLDLGCGSALSSIFLAKEFGVQVWATDLWVKPTENLARITEQGVAERVFPIYAEAHALPFAEGFFDAAISVGAYHYFGTDSIYVGYLSRFLKPGGQLGFVNPGLTSEPEVLPPPNLAEHWLWDFCAFHSPQWWRDMLQRSGRVTIEQADLLPDGWHMWTLWNQLGNLVAGRPEDGPDVPLLLADGGELLGLARVVARRSDP
jgi:SAM-dependent methyltransferase